MHWIHGQWEWDHWHRGCALILGKPVRITNGLEMETNLCGYGIEVLQGQVRTGVKIDDAHNFNFHSHPSPCSFTPVPADFCSIPPVLAKICFHPSSIPTSDWLAQYESTSSMPVVPLAIYVCIHLRRQTLPKLVLYFALHCHHDNFSMTIGFAFGIVAGDSRHLHTRGDL